jgi:Carbonic anhydrase
MPCADEMLAVAAARRDELAALGLGPRPRRKVAALACMDARMDLFVMLGLARGDAHIIRNAGGLVTDDTLRSLSVSQRLLGTEEIVVVMRFSSWLGHASLLAYCSLTSPGHRRGIELGNCSSSPGSCWPRSHSSRPTSALSALIPGEPAWSRLAC